MTMLVGMGAGTQIRKARLAVLLFTLAPMALISGCSGMLSKSTPPSPVTYSVSGTISPAVGGSGATLTLSGTASSATTASSSGQYTFTGLANGTFAITPSNSGYSFNPTTQAVTVNGANVTAVNFTASAAPQTYSVSGTISPVVGGSGATLTLSGTASSTTTASSSGQYTFTGLANGTFAITPSNSGYSFNPTTQSVTVNGANVTAVNFTASAAQQTYSISGTISPIPGGAGDTVTLSGAGAATTLTDASGNYAFNSLSNGNYTVTASGLNTTFSPTSQPVTINNANVSAVNFSATSTANVIFFDDFSAPTLNSQWVALNRAGDYSTGEAQCYLPGNVQTGSGGLVLQSIVQSFTCYDYNMDNSVRHGPSQYAHTSGGVITRTFNFTYGTVEFRGKLAGGQGPWPIVWLLGANCQAAFPFSADNIGTCSWPQGGSDEIDMTEITNSDHTHVNQVIHTGGPPLGPPAHNDGCQPPVSDVSAGFHVYQLIWKPGLVQWNVDGTTTCTVAASYVPSTPMFLLINVAMDGFGGPVNDATLPQSTAVNYIKVTQP